MARVKIQFPETSIFKSSITVSIEHINYGNHVGNERFLGFCHEVRLRYLKSLEQDELNFYGTSLIMADAEVVYKAQAYHGDELTIFLAAKALTPKSFEFYYKILNQKDELVCLVKTGMVYFNYKNNTIGNAPEAWLSKLV